ncbi:MAG: hypothetical protein HZC36_14910 [Armatimonadetes bacterium]|nr:hypothetical protein [Armatimonadota bacterium]
MRPLLEQGTWVFGAVKGLTLAATWLLMARYARVNKRFVEKACIVGTLLYLTIWSVWFFSSH